MAWLLPHRASVEAQRRLNAAVAGVLSENEMASNAAREFGASTEALRVRAVEIEESARQRLQAQEVRRQASGRAPEARMMDNFRQLEAAASRARKDHA